MGRRFFAADSLELAIMKAAREFEVEPEQLAYSKIEKKYGFLKGRKRVVIEVDEDSSSRGLAPEPDAVTADEEQVEAVAVSPEASAEEGHEEGDEEGHEAPAASQPESRSAWDAPYVEAEPEGAEAPEPQEEEEPGLVALPDEPLRATERYGVAAGPLADAAHQALRQLFELADLDLEAQVLQGDDRLEIELSGPGQEALLHDRGRLLLSIQHLVPRLMRGIAGESSACRVDCDNFQEVRAEKLRDMAQRAASEVALKGRARTLEPMSPDERRIVHLTLADDATVETVSKGEGLFKRVTVRPASSGGARSSHRR